MNWQSQGNCAGEVRDGLFFSDSTTRRNQQSLADQAYDMFCRECPVMAKCLTSAITNKDFGIWAGTTKETRDKLSRTRTRTKCPVCSNNLLSDVREFSLCLSCGASWRGER